MSTEQQIRERKWCWTGHTQCNPQGAIERHALDWIPQGTKKRVSKENLEKDMRMGTAEGWRKAKALVLNKTKCKSFKAYVPHKRNKRSE